MREFFRSLVDRGLVLPHDVLTIESCGKTRVDVFRDVAAQMASKNCLSGEDEPLSKVVERMEELFGNHHEKFSPEWYADYLAAALEDREVLGGTALGRGLAAPHAKCPYVASPVVAFVFCDAAIRDFACAEPKAADGQGVTCMFVIISPPDSPGIYLRILQSFSYVLRTDRFFATSLRQARAKSLEVGGERQSELQLV